MSGYDGMARLVRDALEECEVQEDGSCIIRPEHYLQLNAAFEAWDEADDAKRDTGAVIAEAGERERKPIKWRERWYGSEPQRGSAIVDEHGNLIAYFGGDETTHQATTAAVAAHNAALSTPATLDNTAVEGLHAALAECERVAKQQMDDCHRAAHSELIDSDAKRGWASGAANSGVIYRKISAIRATLTAKTEKAE